METLTFLIDVDNTLLANDEIKEQWNRHLEADLGPQLTARFWDLYEKARAQQEVVDIPLALKWLRETTPLSELDEQMYQHVVSIFEDYPFQQALYPGTLETLRYLSALGTTVIVSDGDQFFQAQKIVQSGLADAVNGRVLIYTHKQQELDEVLKLYPADHYAMIDDKPDILADSKEIMDSRLTTVFVEQGKYAQMQKPANFYPNITVEHIADLMHYTKEQFLQA
ncbi:MAG TPA: HAD family hydrolase [Ktedonobacteraceae bacterium]|nr:HAD family hydrolase [Ktedonobacteraceae bacterium]